MYMYTYICTYGYILFSLYISIYVKKYKKVFNHLRLILIFFIPTYKLELFKLDKDINIKKIHASQRMSCM